METIVAAGIAAAGGVLVALVSNKRTERAIKDVQKQVSNVHVSIGNPNGQGNVTQMLENLIEWKGQHTELHRRLDPPSSN